MYAVTIASLASVAGQDRGVSPVGGAAAGVIAELDAADHAAFFPSNMSDKRKLS